MSLFQYCDFFHPDDYKPGFGCFIHYNNLVSCPIVDGELNIIWPKDTTINLARDHRRKIGLMPPAHVAEHGSRDRQVQQGGSK